MSLDIPTLSNTRIEKRNRGYSLICGDPSKCERTIAQLQSNGVSRMTDPHGKDIHVSVLTAEDCRLLAEFLEGLEANQCQEGQQSCERAA